MTTELPYLQEEYAVLRDLQGSYTIFVAGIAINRKIMMETFHSVQKWFILDVCSYLFNMFLIEMYTKEQYTVEMALFYGQCNRDGLEAAFPNESYTAKNTILNVVKQRNGPLTKKFWDMFLFWDMFFFHNLMPETLTKHVVSQNPVYGIF